ncbi:MAG: metallophosphoesterase family protein [Gammaproteobacteria bacterium]|nr:metallophosphoesterase family protein [Gammaproteobacteria bacterium]
MLIQYFSDLHLEFGPLIYPQTEADLIIAAGDIGIYQQGIEWLNTIDKPVLYVAGNHEFYHHEYYDTMETLQTSCENTNIQFLDKKTVVMGDIRFLGCTLWIDAEKALSEGKKSGSNDFKKIRFKNDLLTHQAVQHLNQVDVEWLTKELAQPFDGKTVVITHHAPTFWSWGGSPMAPGRYSYCNDLRHLMYQHNIHSWVHGHTHQFRDYYCSDTRVLCNPRGYWGHHAVNDFQAKQLVEV